MWTTPEQAIRELDHRTSDGIDVTLLWNARTNRVSIAVVDIRTGETFELAVPGADAVYAFNHPHAYAGMGVADRALAA